ncbi:MAG: hypothetical protein H0X33_07495 [Taibaiella sp.]|nr:hypothetical protein [Taibaiella sp.]
MKRLLYITLCLALIANAAPAQVRRPVRPAAHPERAAMAHPMRARIERIHAIKVAYITDKLHFTSEQSAKFWPVYGKYEEDIKATRKQFFQKYKNTNPDQADDNTSRQFIEDNLDYQQEVLNTRRRYNDEFQKVLSPQQVADLYKSEREFNLLLIQQLKKRQAEGAGVE